VFAVLLPKNEPAELGFEFPIVPPFKVHVPPAATVSANDWFMKKAAPLLTVIVWVLKADPVFVTVPSSTVTEAAVWADVRFTVKAPVASLLAEKFAASVPLTKFVVATPPFGSVDHVALFQVPPGVAPPAPAPAPLMSQ
jgi:hypothetical protein